MKKFVYCFSEEGGMSLENFEFKKDKDITKFDIPGWMEQDCIENDVKLLIWANRANIGEYHHHRMGTIFCVNQHID